MKLKYIFFFAICFMLATINTYASSIEYNLTIDDDMNFHENNIYTVKESELSKTGYYDFMTSVVKDKINFDEDRQVKYKKTSKKSNGVYTITLKNDYNPSFLAGSRIIKECFSKYDIVNDGAKISIKTTSPFYCSSRAGSITINIKTNLAVLSNNAKEHNNNVYTWYPTDDSFSLYFGVSQNKSKENKSMDEIVGEDPEADDSSDNTTDQTEDQQTPETKDQNPYAGIIIASVFILLSVIAIIIIIVLKNKKNSLNKI